MNNYYINTRTMAILVNDRGESIIYEDRRFIINKNRPNFIIKKNCLNYGKSLEASISITKILTGICYKPPIIIDQYRNLIFFPTKSLRNRGNEWICLNKIKSYYENRMNKRTVIEFLNGKILEFDVSYNVMNNQIMRAYYLQSKIRPFIPNIV